METGGVPRRRRSPIGGLILIVVGVFFLLVTMRPDFDPWPILAHYWPVILIVIGLGKIWDAIANRQNADGTLANRNVGGLIALVILVVLFGIALWKGRRKDLHGHGHANRRGEGRETVSAIWRCPRNAQVERRLGEASRREFPVFRARKGSRAWIISSAAITASLPSRANEKHLHVGTTHSEWDLRFSNNVPLDLNFEMGAGQSDLRLRDLT